MTDQKSPPLAAEAVGQMQHRLSDETLAMIQARDQRVAEWMRPLSIEETDRRMLLQHLAALQSDLAQARSAVRFWNERATKLSEELGAVNLYADSVKNDLTQAREQLPPEMPNCTIRFIECEQGHGRLTANNWVDHGCQTCERDKLQADLTEAREALERIASGARYSMYDTKDCFNGLSECRDIARAFLAKAKGAV